MTKIWPVELQVLSGWWMPQDMNPEPDILFDCENFSFQFSRTWRNYGFRPPGEKYFPGQWSNFQVKNVPPANDQTSRWEIFPQSMIKHLLSQPGTWHADVSWHGCCWTKATHVSSITCGSNREDHKRTPEMYSQSVWCVGQFVFFLHRNITSTSINN